MYLVFCVVLFIHRNKLQEKGKKRKERHTPTQIYSNIKEVISSLNSIICK